jgi:uncharacterized protein YbaR (Trm112 family)
MAIYYNSNGQLQNFDEWENTVVCPKCKKPYHQYCEEQVPGFRDMSYDICPYCKNDNGHSMSEEYTNTQFTEKELKEYLKKN